MVNMEHMENMVMDMGMKARSEIDEYLENSSTMSTMKSLSQLVVAFLQHTMYLNLKSSAHPDLLDCSILGFSNPVDGTKAIDFVVTISDWLHFRK